MYNVGEMDMNNEVQVLFSDSSKMWSRSCNPATGVRCTPSGMTSWLKKLGSKTRFGDFNFPKAVEKNALTSGR